MIKLNETVEVNGYDGLITDTLPRVILRPGTIKQLGEAATYKRGTLLAKGEDGKLVIAGTAGTAGTFSGTGDGSKKVFSLIASGVIPATVTEVKVDGTALTSGWMYNAASGDLIFDSAPANTKTIAVKHVSGTFEADCILADDTEIGTTADVTALCYVAGCFDPEKVIVAEGYTVSAADYDALRVKGILFKNAQNV